MKLCKTVIFSSFNYCPLVRMFCGKDANHKIYSTHKRALRIIHTDYDSSLNTLLKKSDNKFKTLENAKEIRFKNYHA